MTRIVIRESRRAVFVDSTDIDWIDGADYYSRIHAGQRTHLIRQTLASLAASLGADRFMRIHRSVLVNLGRVYEVRTARVGGDVVAVLKDGTRLKVSRARRAELERRLGAYVL